MSIDVDLMAETTEKMVLRLRNDLQSLLESHGSDFAVSVMGNIGVDMISGVMAAAVDDEARNEILVAVLKSLVHNTMREMSNYETEELLDRLKKGKQC